MDVVHLWTLLESWALASHTNFKLAWKTVTLLALVTTKHCSDLTLLCMDNQHLFLRHCAGVLIPASGGKIDQQGLQSTDPFRKNQMDHMYHLLFLFNNRMHMQICAKTIYSWVRKVLCIAIAHMSLGSLWGAAAPVALAAGVSLVFILQVGDRAGVSTPARQYFSNHITPTDQLQDSVQCVVLGLSE